MMMRLEVILRLDDDTRDLVLSAFNTKRQLDRIEGMLRTVLTQQEREMATLDDVLTGVQQESTVDDSILALVTNLQAQVAAQGGDPAKIQAIFDQVKANIAKVSAAVTTGTPAAKP